MKAEDERIRLELALEDRRLSVATPKPAFAPDCAISQDSHARTSGTTAAKCRIKSTICIQPERAVCVNYVTVSRQLAFEFFRTPMEEAEDWRDELYQDYVGPIIVQDGAGKRKGLSGSYGFIPKRHLPHGQRLTTMNARAETVGQLRTYKSAWAKSQLCLVPMRHFFEPNWEQPAHVRWSIGMASGEPFAVAGLYREWEEEDGKRSFAFTQLTINADEHPFMNRFHRPGEEKRSLVIVPSTDYDGWLGCKDPERARTYLQPYPANLMSGEPAPKESAAKQAELF